MKQLNHEGSSVLSGPWRRRYEPEEPVELDPSAAIVAWCVVLLVLICVWGFIWG